MLSDVAGRVSRSPIQPLAAGDPAELGGYEIRGRIGSGGMGAVYLGATRSGRPLAIKVIRPEHAGDREFRARFRREVAAASRIRSRRTAAVIDFDVEAAMPWLATEYVPGPTLAQAVRELGPLPEQAVRELLAGLSEALDTIHREGLVHRDLKPANVLLSPDGPVLIDMGIVTAPENTSLTMTGLQPGTPQFMSPEQARGETVGAASDVWSLGTVAYLAATGRAPFGTGTLATTVYRIVHDEPALVDVPDALRPLIAACLAKDPAARPAPSAVLRSATGTTPGTDLPVYDAAEPTGALEDPTQLRAGTSPGVATTVPGVPDSGARPARSRRGLLIGLVAAGLALAGGGTAAAMHFLGPDDGPPAAAQPSDGTSATTSARPVKDQAKEPKKSPKPSRSASPSATPSSPASSAEPTTGGGTTTPAAPRTFTPGAVRIPADVAVGQKVSVQISGWSPGPSGRSCRWSIGGAERANLGSCTYTVTIDDVGKTIQAELTATRDGYTKRSVRSNQTSAVPQPQVAVPSCTVTWSPGKVHEGWFGHCEFEQDPNVTYRWQWKDTSTGEIVSKNEVETGPTAWIHGGHAGKDVVCVVTAERDGYRSNEVQVAATVPSEWEPAG